jgi:hypothetical protein
MTVVARPWLSHRVIADRPTATAGWRAAVIGFVLVFIPVRHGCEGLGERRIVVVGLDEAGFQGVRVRSNSWE